MKKIIAYDEKVKGVVKCGTAYYRLPKELKEFFNICVEKHEVIGFEWEEGSWNFGVILRDKEGR